MCDARIVVKVISAYETGKGAIPDDVRYHLHRLVRETAIRVDNAGYWAEMDAYSLQVMGAWPGYTCANPHVVAVVNPRPLFPRSITLCSGKSSSFIIARTLQQAILNPIVGERFQSAPAVVLVDGEKCFISEELAKFVVLCGGTLEPAVGGCPHAKPFVESFGSCVRRNSLYPINELRGIQTKGVTRLSLPGEVLARVCVDAARKTGAKSQAEYENRMRRQALALDSDQVLAISEARFPTAAEIRGDTAILESGETFGSRSISLLDDGFYSATRALNPRNDNIIITIEGEPVAQGDRCQALPEDFPQDLVPYTEAPRL
jgi:hypothetical protein